MPHYAVYFGTGPYDSELEEDEIPNGLMEEQIEELQQLDGVQLKNRLVGADAVVFDITEDIVTKFRDAVRRLDPPAECEIV